jgi:nicotinic acid mononucleotide adenylyltransferase
MFLYSQKYNSSEPRCAIVPFSHMSDENIKDAFENKLVVLFPGSFNVFHCGHFNDLKNAICELRKMHDGLKNIHDTSCNLPPSFSVCALIVQHYGGKRGKKTLVDFNIRMWHIICCLKNYLQDSGLFTEFSSCTNITNTTVFVPVDVQYHVFFERMRTLEVRSLRRLWFGLIGSDVLESLLHIRNFPVSSDCTEELNFSTLNNFLDINPWSMIVCHRPFTPKEVLSRIPEHWISCGYESMIPISSTHIQSLYSSGLWEKIDMKLNMSPNCSPVSDCCPIPPVHYQVLIERSIIEMVKKFGLRFFDLHNLNNSEVLREFEFIIDDIINGKDWERLADCGNIEVNVMEGMESDIYMPDMPEKSSEANEQMAIECNG